VPLTIPLHDVLQIIADNINAHFKERLQISEDVIVLSNIVNLDGSIAIQGQNKICMTMINLTEDNSIRNLARGGEQQYNFSTAVLFSAYFDGNNYSEALKFIAMVLEYWRQNPVMRPDTHPALPPNITSLSMSLHGDNANTEAMSGIWRSLGAKLMPALLYRVQCTVLQ